MWFITKKESVKPVEQIICDYKLTRKTPSFNDSTKIYTTQWDIETNDLAVDASVYVKVK
jgi:hypothetical protein